ncbi:hypothetical protein DB459_21920 [Bradyrhizobium sp. WD16]|nr:hypothetical protein DB459_21920 [Bradyrhizobium sp. WD16]
MRNRELLNRYGPSASGDYLFNGTSIFDILHNQERQAGNAPTSINDDELLNTPTDDLVDRLVAQFSIDVPVLDRAAAWVDSSEGPVAVRDYWSRGVEPGYTVLGTLLRLSVPFSGDAEAFAIQPSTIASGPPRARVVQGAIVIAYSAVELNPQQAKAELEDVIDNIEKHLGWLRQSVNPFNEKLKTVVRTAVEARKAKVLKDRNSIAALGFNLKPRPDAPKTYVAPVKRKPVGVQTVKAMAPFKPEPVLDEETYKHILKIMEGMAHVMERSPSAFETMGEEALRQHFLVQLNGQFEGAATGETFNHSGKTDILIREKDRNIFIAECKFWGGEKAFLDTITQLLGYLSWRDTKAAVVIFSQNVDFSKVLATIETAIPKHPNHKRGPVKESETRFRSVFGNPTDANREVIVTVMAFNVPK